MTHCIVLAGQKHPLRMSLAAARVLTEKFGDLGRMGEVLQSAGMAEQIDAINTVLTVLMKAGRVYAAACGEELPPELPCEPIDLIDASDSTVLSTILGTMTGDTAREVEAQSKNGEATRGD